MKTWRHRYIRCSPRGARELAALHPQDVRSIAVIKHAALGDLILARPFLTTLRKHFPNAKLTFGAIANYLNGVPEDLVERVHVAVGQVRPRPPWRERVRSYRELGHHDLLFDLTASSTSAWITALNPARIKVGYRHHFLAQWLYDVAIPRHIFQFEAQNFLDQLAALRLSYDYPLDFGYPPAPPYTGVPYVLHFPTASVPEKCWRAEAFGELMGRLAAAHPQCEQRLLFGVKAWEVATAEQALAAAGDAPQVRAVRDATGDTFRALVRDARLLVSNDTGVRNLAIGLGTPTLGIFPNTFVNTYLPRFGHHAVVYDAEGRQPTVDAVEAAAERLLAELPPLSGATAAPEA